MLFFFSNGGLQGFYKYVLLFFKIKLIKELFIQKPAYFLSNDFVKIM